MPEQNYNLGAVLTHQPLMEYTVGSVTEKITGKPFEFQLGTVSKLRNSEYTAEFDIGVTMRWLRKFEYSLGVYQNHILASNSFDDIKYIYSPTLAGTGKTTSDVEKQIFAESESDHLGFSGDDKLSFTFNQKQKMTIALLFETNTTAYTLLSAKNRNDVPYYLRTNSTGDQLVYCNGDFENIVSFANPIQQNTKYLMVIKEDQILLHEYDTIDYNNNYTLFPEEGTWDGFGLLKDEIVFGEGFSRNFQGKLYGMVIAGETFGFQEAKAIFGKSDIEIEDSCSLRPIKYNYPAMHSVISDKIKNYITQFGATSFLDNYRYQTQYSVPLVVEAFGKFGVQFSTGLDNESNYLGEYDTYQDDVNKNYSSQISATYEKDFNSLLEIKAAKLVNNHYLSTIQTFLNTPVYNLATQFRIIQDPILRYATVLRTNLEAFDQSYNVMYAITKDPSDVDDQYGKYGTSFNLFGEKNKNYASILTVMDAFDNRYGTQYALEKWYVTEESYGANEDNYGRMIYGSQVGTATSHPGGDNYRPHAYPAMISAVYAHRSHSFAIIPVSFDVYYGEQTQRHGTSFRTSFFRPMKLGPVEFSTYGQFRKKYGTIYPLEAVRDYNYSTIEQAALDHESNHPVQFGTGVKELNRGSVGFYLLSDAPKKYGSELILEDSASDKNYAVMHSVTHMYMDRFQFKTPVLFMVTLDNQVAYATQLSPAVRKEYNPLVQFGVGVGDISRHLTMYSAYNYTVVTDYGKYGVLIHTAKDTENKFLTAHEIESKHDKKYFTTQELEWTGNKAYGSEIGTGNESEDKNYASEINVGHVKNNNLLTQQNAYDQFDKAYSVLIGTQATSQPKHYGVIFKSGIEYEPHYPTQFIRWGVIPNKFGVEFTIEPIYSISFRTFNSSAIPRYSEITDTSTVAEYLTEDNNDEMD
jgi:hypothetical protein